MAIPELVYAQASPLSLGGVSMFDVGGRVSRQTVHSVTSPRHIIQASLAHLRQAGFQILHVTSVAINFAGPPDLFEKAFRTKIVEREVDLARGATATHLHSEDSDVLGLISTAGTPFAGVIEGVALEVPRYSSQSHRYLPQWTTRTFRFPEI